MAALVIFACTYLGLAVGRIPGLALDRTGFALLGATAALALGCLDLEEARAAVDVPTLAILFGMMLLSAQYRLSGLYTAISDRIVAVRSPQRLLFAILVASALLSAVLTNDVVCFALTPLLAVALVRAGREPLPYLLALACASNIGSALTPIGNPQNILIAQRLGLGFLPFVLACALPVLLCLGATYALLAPRLRPLPAPPALDPALAARRPLDRPEAAKALVLTLAVIALFLTPIPAWLTALVAGGIVLTSRKMHTREMLSLVDWHLLVLFVGLFIVLRAFEKAGWTEATHRLLLEGGLQVTQGWVLVPVVALLSNLVSNVPAVMLLLPFVRPDHASGITLALGSTLAGNALLVSSIANLIVAEQAARLGLPFSFREHARIGLPLTAFSLLAAALAAASLTPG